MSEYIAISTERIIELRKAGVLSVSCSNSEGSLSYTFAPMPVEVKTKDDGAPEDVPVTMEEAMRNIPKLPFRPIVVNDE